VAPVGNLHCTEKEIAIRVRNSEHSVEFMKVVAIACARNEADIIEAFVRHTAAYCSRVIIVDHGSADETPEILRSLQREGLPLHVISDATVGNLQTAHMNRMLKIAAHDFAADWVVCLDADEFIQGPLEAAFSSADRGAEPCCFRVPLRNYVAHPTDSASIVNPVERLTHHEVDAFADVNWTHCKVIVPGQFARDENGFVEQGNHRFLINGFETPTRKLDDVWLGHFSIRLPSQYASKLVSKTLQKYRKKAERTHDEDFYEKPFREMRDSYSAFTKDFHKIRLSWTQRGEHPEELVRDPIKYRGGPLRYTPEALDTDQFIKQILDLTESLARTSPEGPNASAEKDGAGAPTVSISIASPGNPKVKEVRDFKADPSGFSTVTVPLTGAADANQLRVSISSEPGMIEISEIALVYSGEPSLRQTFDIGALKEMVKYMEMGVLVDSSATVRILISQLPMHFTFEGWRLQRPDGPVEAVLKIRFINDRRMLTSTVFSPAVIAHLVAAQNTEARWSRNKSRGKKKRERPQRNASDNSYTPGQTVRFDDPHDGIPFAKSGWGEPEHWGTWSVAPEATLAFQFTKPPCRALVLGVSVCMLSVEGHREMRVRVLAAGQLLATWLLNSKKIKHFDVEIPAEKLSVPELKITFEMDKPVCPAEIGISSDNRKIGIGIKKLSLEKPVVHRIKRILYRCIGR
jgi:glycosyltransferase involved in cell wall biosynthesis